jgi:hypothetical protein
LPHGNLRMTMPPDLYAKRFTAALMLSCLLHAALVVLPYLGTAATAGRPARAVLKAGKARALQAPGILSVRFVTEGEAAAASETPPPPQSAPDAAPAPVLEPTPERAPGIDLLPIPAPAFYTTDQLTRRPQLTSAPMLQVPDQDPYFGAGKVVLKLRISELGIVMEVNVEEHSVPQAVAARAAEVFAGQRFVPGEINGRRVGSVMRIEVTYDENADENPDQSKRDDAARDGGRAVRP